MSRPTYTGYTSAKSLASIRAACDEPLTEKERAPHQEYLPIPKYTPIPPLLDGVPDIAMPKTFWLWLFGFIVRSIYVALVAAFFFGVATLLISWGCDTAGYDFVPLAVFGY